MWRRVVSPGCFLSLCQLTPSRLGAVTLRRTAPLFSLASVLPLTLLACSPVPPMPKSLASESEQPWGILSPVAQQDENLTPKPIPSSPPQPSLTLTAYNQYRSVIEQTRNLIGDPTSQRLAQQWGLNILDITWEDTGRYKGSAVGPNISDMTIQVQQFNPRSAQYELSLMPVIRHPNFSDKTADIPLDRLYLRVGNEKNRSLQRISLKAYLQNLRSYLHQPNSWRGSGRSLLADRDSHVLVSAQACFLPIPQGDKATFNPVLFNYQSYEQNPAVLTILATREGTSATIIDNKRDAFAAGMTWGQRLFFNKNGERASLTGQRASDFSTPPVQGDNPGPITSSQAEEQGLNLVMLIQVPLKQKPQPRSLAPMPMMAPSAAGLDQLQKQESNVEAAVIGHGPVEGPYTEIDNLAIERDPRFPIRVTVQFYKATSNGVVSDADMEQIASQINRVYADADYVGSLVVEGETGRPTEYDGPKQQPPGWWNDFWQQYEANTGQSRQEALEMLRRLRGETWIPRSEQELQQQLKQLE